MFDSLDEVLANYIRPFGLKGAPLPWDRKNPITHPKPPNLNQIKEKVLNQMVQWNQIQAGKLPQTKIISKMYAKLLENSNIPKIDWVEAMKNDRLAIMCAYEIREQEENWVDYSYEEAQVKIDLADMVLEELATETINLLDKIEENKKKS